MYRFLNTISFLQSVFAWEAYEKGADVHLQADPTKLELLHKEYRVKKGDFEQDKKLTVLEKVRIAIKNEDRNIFLQSFISRLNRNWETLFF